MHEGSTCPEFQAHKEPNVLEVQLSREEGRKQRDVKGIVPSLNPTNLAAAKESGVSMSVPCSLLLKSCSKAD